MRSRQRRHPHVGAPVQPSTRSASTAPASTDASWSAIADQDQPRVRAHRLQQPAPSSSATPSTSRRPRSRRAAAGCRDGAGTVTTCPAGCPAAGAAWSPASLKAALGQRRRACRPLAAPPPAAVPPPCRSAPPARSAAAHCPPAPPVGEQRQQPRDRCRLAGPGPPVSTVTALRQRDFRGRPLLLVAGGKAGRCPGDPPVGGRADSSVADRRTPVVPRASTYPGTAGSAYSRSTGGDPSNGLAATAASQSWARGHGRSATPTCSSADRRSTHTEPPRSARTANATASATR